MRIVDLIASLYTALLDNHGCIYGSAAQTIRDRYKVLPCRYIGEHWVVSPVPIAIYRAGALNDRST